MVSPAAAPAVAAGRWARSVARRVQFDGTKGGARGACGVRRGTGRQIAGPTRGLASIARGTILAGAAEGGGAAAP